MTTECVAWKKICPVMPALGAGIHAFLVSSKQDVDGRDKPGHDAESGRR
jgi:hypothetical protein